MIDNYWIKTTISVIVIGFLIFYPMQVVNSAGAVAYILKEFGLDLIARVFARNFLNTMMNSMTDFISKNGRDKLPNFVQDWRYFLEDAQYRGEDITRAIIGDAIGTGPGSGTICDYLKNPLSNAFGASRVPGFNASSHRVDSLQYYRERNRCTLPTGFNVNTFRNDFSAGGGWAAWNQLIQPQNNIWGVFADTQSELTSQRGFEEARDRSEAEAGSGFTSKLGGDDNGCSVKGGNSFCLVLGSILTPAKILETAGSKLNQSEFDFVTGCDELSECIFNVLYSVVGRLGNLAATKVTDQFNVRPEDEAQKDTLMEKARQDCIKAGENTCTEKAKTLDCDASATSGSGGSGDEDNSSGGSGGDSSVDCEEIIDSRIYNAWMAEVNDKCNIK